MRFINRAEALRTVTVSFAAPAALVLLGLPPALLFIVWYGSQRRRALLSRFGLPEALAALSSLTPRRRRWSRLLLLGGVASLAVVLAGPRWGRGDPGVVSGRDLVIVLDLSKSMLADDMRDPSGESKQRWQAAQAGIRDLVESIRQRGGHRIGLVVFAARPWTVCPLTADYDQFLMRLDEFSPKAPPPEVNPNMGEKFVSGTRIGAAIAEAVKAHDPRFPGYQQIWKISDGDHPASDRDAEIEAGARLAREAQIPIFTVGVGDPEKLTVVALKDLYSTKLVKALPAARDCPGDARRVSPRPPRQTGPDGVFPHSHRAAPQPGSPRRCSPPAARPRPVVSAAGNRLLVGGVGDRTVKACWQVGMHRLR